MAFGTLGDLNSYRGSQKPTSLPQWLLDQFSANTTVDEGGGQNTSYSLNNNPYGGFQRDGKYYVQVGQNKLKDPSAVQSDPELGDYTSVDNINDITPQGPNWGMLAAVVGAGLLGPMMGLGAESGLGGSMTGLAGDESLGLLGTGSYQGAGTGLLSGAGAGEGAGGGFGSTYGIDTSFLPQVTVPEVPAIGSMTPYAGATPWWQSALQGVTKNPMNALRLGAGLYSMATANNQHPGATGGSSGLGSVADASGVQQYNPLQAMGQFQQNPWLLAQMNSVPFMSGGSNGLLGR